MLSGLSARHRQEARRLVQQAAILSVRHRSRIHYTQGALRWQGVDRRRVAIEGQYPEWGDCSGWGTWLYWCALHHRFGIRDVVNNCGWREGYTGTMLLGGIHVSLSEIRAGDAVIYGPGTGEHVAIYTGGGLVASHGREAGPELIPVRYRRDVIRVRRYI